MKAVIKSIMDKQGINKAELLRQTKIYKIDRILYGKACELNQHETRHLQFLSRKLSRKVANQKEPIIVHLNNKEYINVVACLPNKTQTGFSLYVKKQANRLAVWYQTRTRARSESTFKALIRLNADFVACLGLSLGDGLNNPSARNTHYTFANTNFQLTHLIFKWLKKDFGLNLNEFQLSLGIPILQRTVPDTRDLERKFGHCVSVYRLERYRNKTLTLQISNRIFQCLYSTLFNKLKRKILQKSILRRAFLKGLFAAEGHVKHSVYGTIESMSFSYNPYVEQKLISFVKKCLEADGINAKDNRRGLLYFCSYESMLRFHFMGGLSVHKAKEKKFVKLLKNAEIVLHFKDGYLRPLKKLSQHSLAKTLECSQSAISIALKENFFSLKNLLRCGHLLDVSYNSLIKHTEFATVRTSFVQDEESVKLLLSLLIEP